MCFWLGKSVLFVARVNASALKLCTPAVLPLALALFFCFFVLAFSFFTFRLFCFLRREKGSFSVLE